MAEVAAMARRLDDSDAIAWIAWTSAELDVALGRSAEARSLLEDAIEAWQRSGTVSGVGWCHLSLGWVAVADHDHEDARRHFAQAAELAETGDWMAAHALAALAPVTVLLGDRQQGRHLADQALEYAEGLALQGVYTMALVRAAETAILARTLVHAGQLLSKLFEILNDQASLRWVADALEMATLVPAARDNAAAAVEALGSASALRADTGETGGIWVLGAKMPGTRDHLIALLGTAGFMDIEARGRKRRPDAAISETLTSLRDHFPLATPAPVEGEGAWSWI